MCLKRALKKAADLGFTFYTHPEVEFFLFKDPIEPGKAPMPVDQSGYFDHTPQSLGSDFRRRAITMLEQMGISVEYSHHEGAPGQQEIDLRYADALSTADNLMTFRVVVKEVALSQGIHASFMPKPFTEHPGPACTRTCRSSRVTPMPSTTRARNITCPRSGGTSSPACSPRRRDHRGDQPVDQLLQAAGRRRRGAQLHLLGSQQPLRAGPGADVQAEQGILGPGRAALHRLRRQSLPGLCADAGDGAGRDRGRVRAARGRRGRRLVA